MSIRITNREAQVDGHRRRPTRRACRRSDVTGLKVNRIISSLDKPVYSGDIYPELRLHALPLRSEKRREFHGGYP